MAIGRKSCVESKVRKCASSCNIRRCFSSGKPRLGFWNGSMHMLLFCLKARDVSRASSTSSFLPSFFTAMLVLVPPVARKKLSIWLVTLLPLSAALTAHCLEYLACGARPRLLHNGRLLSEFWKSYPKISTVHAASVRRSCSYPSDLRGSR